MNVDILQANLSEITRANVQVEALSPTKISVSVCWPETADDHCHGQLTIVSEAWNVLNALERLGWQHAEFAGRKDFGHSGGTTHFACAK